MAKSNLAITILISIVLTAVLIAFINVGLFLFLEKPDYSDYCTGFDECPPGIRCLHVDNQVQECDNQAYEDDVANFNQIRFYFFAGIGLFFILAGLFIPISVIQWTGIATGGILLTQGIVTNFQNKLLVFLTLGFTIIIIGLGTWRALKR